jgi:hypothetical protein
MTRKLKTLGLAVVAIMALSAVIASASQAAAAKFMAETSYPAPVKGVSTNTHTFTTPAGITLSCTTATFTGIASAESAELTMGPKYENCSTKVLGITFPVKATIGEAGHKCDYLFHAGVTTATADEYAGTVDVKCEAAGEDITVDVFESKKKEEENVTFCQLHIAPQTGLGAINYNNNTAASPKSVAVEASVAGIATTRTGSALCGAATSSASYAGKVTVTATTAGGAAQGVTLTP